MGIPFTKASACGNDFLIIDSQYAPPDLREFSRRICDRHNGAGADGVEWLFPAQDADVSARLINADGSEAEISGNGTRCVAAYLVDRGNRGNLRIRTGAGVKACEMKQREGRWFHFEMDMDKPQVGDPFPVPTTRGKVSGYPVSMGNPHYVIFVQQFSAQWQAEAGEIARDSHFPQGVNIEFVRPAEPREIEVRFYERGVGETQSSGTGSCSSAVAAIAAGKANSPVTVQAPGGAQVVRWEKGSVYLTGPAQLIYRGEYLG